MLKVTLLEFIIRGIPEGFIFILANFAFAKKKIVWVPFVVSSIILIMFTYGVRFLDINFGVHTILNLICLIFLSVFFIKIDLYTAVKGSMITTLGMFAVEAISVLVLQAIYGDNLAKIIEDPIQKAIAGSPGFFLFGIIIIALYFHMTRKPIKGSKDGTTGEQSSK